jgi:energy-coupling factor transport system substrate-specific component
MNLGALILVLLLSLFALLLLIFEKSKADEKVIAVIATLGALAAVARIPFAGLPNIQPTTFLVMVSGYVFGVRVGFLTGAIAALFSNVFLGQGPWTLWQMLAWGLAGASAGLLCRALENKREGQLLATRAKRWIFTGACTMWGYLFGWIMNLWIFFGLGATMNMKSLMALNAGSFFFDTAHAVGNFLFARLFAESFTRIFQRYHRKLTVSRINLKGDK